MEAGPAELARRAAAHVVVDDLTSPALSDEDAHHLRAVLRLRPGELVSVTDGRGGWRSCTWAPAGSLSPTAEAIRFGRPAPAVSVGFAPVKGDRNEWAVQKLTELGVDRIVLLRTERSVVRWDERRAVAHIQRLRKVARQAVMQSRRMWLPEVDGVVGLKDLLTDVGPPDGVAVTDPAGGPVPAGVSTLLVGPEGGWSDSELLGRTLVGLGGGVLRTETAAIAAAALLTSIRAGLVLPATGDPC